MDGSNQKLVKTEVAHINLKDLEELKQYLDNDRLDQWVKLPDLAYFGPYGLSRSKLVKYLKCPAQIFVPEKDTKAFLFGRAFHARLLEKELFDSQYSIEPDFGDKRKKKNKEAFEDWKKAVEGRRIISKDDVKTIDQMIESVLYDADATELIDAPDANPELAAFGHINDVLCKCKLDIWLADSRSIVEIKTTSASSQEQFERNFFDYNYDIQVAFYFDVVSSSISLDVNEYYVLGVQKEPPYQVFKVVPDMSTFDLGRVRYSRLLDTHKQCVADNFWPNSKPGFSELRAPAYLINKHL